MAKCIHVCASRNALFALDEEGGISHVNVKLLATRESGERRVSEAARRLPLVVPLYRLESRRWVEGS